MTLTYSFKKSVIAALISLGVIIVDIAATHQAIYAPGVSGISFHTVASQETHARILAGLTIILIAGFVDTYLLPWISLTAGGVLANGYAAIRWDGVVLDHIELSGRMFGQSHWISANSADFCIWIGITGIILVTLIFVLNELIQRLSR